MTSSFGVRIDPFLGRAGDAYRNRFPRHAGRIRSAHRVRHRHAGRLERRLRPAGRSRPWHGLATRYGHLSEIDVTIGQTIKIGQIVGRLGSTGRSTGPICIMKPASTGEAVDPQKFLRAGIRMGSFQ